MASKYTISCLIKQKLGNDKEYVLLPIFYLIIYKCLSSEGYLHNDIITIMFEEDVDAITTIDTTCSYKNICTNNTICTVTLLADGYDPDLDWGKFSVEVSQGNTSSRQSVVVDADPRLLLLVKPLSASVEKVRKGQDGWCSARIDGFVHPSIEISVGLEPVLGARLENH